MDNRPKITEDTVLNTYHATREPWVNATEGVYEFNPNKASWGIYGSGLYSSADLNPDYGKNFYNVYIDDPERYIRSAKRVDKQPTFIQQAIAQAVKDNRQLTKEEILDLVKMPTYKHYIEKEAKSQYNDNFGENNRLFNDKNTPKEIKDIIEDIRNKEIDNYVNNYTDDLLNKGVSINDYKDFSMVRSKNADPIVKLLEPYGVRGVYSEIKDYYQTPNPMATVVTDINNQLDNADVAKLFNERINKGLLPAHFNPAILNQDIDFKTLLNTDIPIPKAAANLMKNPVVKGAAKAAGVAAIPLDIYFAHQDVGVPLAKTVDFEEQIRQPTEFASLSPKDQAYVKEVVPNMITQTEYKTTPLDIIKQYGAEQAQAWNILGDWVNIMKSPFKPLTKEEEGKLYGN